MPVDEVLNARMRRALAAHAGISEKRMMGGVCFLLNGNMIGGADRPKDGTPRLMFRVGKDNQAEADKLPGAQPMEMGGRRMSGFYFVDAEDCDEDALKQWMSQALKFVTTLPPK